MNHLHECPFCRIVSAYPLSSNSGEGDSSHSQSSSSTSPSYQTPYSRGHDRKPSHSAFVPQNPDPERIVPYCYLVLNTEKVAAFLDLMPMTRGHTLVIAREHRVKVADLWTDEGAAIGAWLPIVSRAVAKAVGVEDWNIVQNNGIRAAQVVPHVHFHIIPRPGNVPEIRNRSWTMFGRGQREDLDDEEAKLLSSQIRQELEKEISAMDGRDPEGRRLLERL